MTSADLNGDGNADLASVQLGPATLAVLFGTGTGAFRAPIIYRTPPHPEAVTIADFDRDGDLDVATASAGRRGRIAVFVNAGGGRLQRAASYPSAPKAYAVAAADVNHDGLADLMTANEGRRHFTVLIGLGAGRFRLAHRYTGAPASDVALGDLDRDGEIDAVLATRNKAGSIAVRLGRGDGRFGRAALFTAGDEPWGIALGDLNGDGNTDVAAATYGGGQVYVLSGTGDGRFRAGRRWYVGSYPDAVLISDFDRDGDLDLTTSSLLGPYVLAGRGDGTFLPPYIPTRDIDTIVGTQGGATGDFNGDGWPDVAFGYAELGDNWPWLVVFLNWTGQPAPPCVVPQLDDPDLRETLGSARRRLRLYGCRVGTVEYRYSGTVTKGEVISQAPGANQVLASGGHVNLMISRGHPR